MSCKQEISIYVHWPFCESKCPYCDFNSHVRNIIDHELFLKGYLQEISLYKPLLTNRKIKSIFFGGGTPSLAQPKMFAEILNFLSTITNIDTTTEITIEANPGSVEVSKFLDFARAGINRISIGVQSFDDKALQFLGRKHNASAAKRAIEYVDKAFKNYSFDLIYALPWHNLDNWTIELINALSYAKYHLSLYQLTIEKGTKFFKDYALKKFQLPEETLSAELYEITNDILSAHQFEMYEISNHAHNGFQCQHNLVYWQYGDYVGIGPGAHSRISVDKNKLATINVYLPEKWIELSLNNKLPYQSQEILSLNDQLNEKLIMGLRLTNGITIDEFNQNNKFKNKITELINQNLLELNDNKITVTPNSRLVLNSIINLLL